jgi:hypothetical protein
MPDELKPKVISVSTLPELLLLREYVLQSVGCDVLSITNLQEAASRIEDKSHCGVLLLCYEVPHQWRYSLITKFREHCPKGRIVAITNEPIAEPPREVDDLVYGVEGPEALIDAIQAAAPKETSLQTFAEAALLLLPRSHYQACLNRLIRASVDARIRIL